MAVSVLDAATTHTVATPASGTYTAFADAVSAGSDRMLLLFVSVGDAEAASGPTAVTYGGQAMTQLWSAYDGTWARSQCWYLKEAGIAAAGSTTFALSILTITHLILGAVTLQGVDQTTTFRNSGVGTTGTGTSTTPTVADIPSASGDYVIAGLATEDDNAFAQGGTLLWEIEGFGSDTGGGAQSYAGDTTITATWTTDSQPYGAGGISIIPTAAAAVASVLPPRLQMVRSRRRMGKRRAS